LVPSQVRPVKKGKGPGPEELDALVLEPQEDDFPPKRSRKAPQRGSTSASKSSPAKTSPSKTGHASPSASKGRSKARRKRRA
jgi:hypothetical protein